MTKRCECGGKLPTRKKYGPAPRLCPDCRARNNRAAKKRWWANNPEMSAAYSRDWRLRRRIASNLGLTSVDEYAAGEIDLGTLLARMSGREA